MSVGLFQCCICRGKTERMNCWPEHVPKLSHPIHMSVITGRRNKQAGCVRNTKGLPSTPAIKALNKISETTS